MPLSQSGLQSPSPYYQVLAAAGIANAAANTTAVNVNASVTQKVQVFINFTVGSLTNAIFTPQLSVDGTNWHDVTSPGALTLTATGKKCFVVDCTGAKLFRLAVSSTGTITNSAVTIDIAYQKGQFSN